MEKPVDKALIRKFISNNCTPEEVARIGSFLEQPGSDSIFEEILNKNWTDGKDEDPFDPAQMQGWEDRFSKKVAQVSPKPKGRFKLPPYFKYAAVWTILAVTAGSYGWYHMHKKEVPETIAMLESRTAPGKLVKLLLPDSTVVYLNAASRLQYPEKFTGKTRTVILQGEAFFDVKHDKQHPFVVQADKLNIHVLGTSFNIRSYQNDEDIAVTVTTGKVGVTVPAIRKGQASFLLPDNELTYTKTSGKLNVRKVNAADSRAWGTGSFIFHYETLETITKRLSRWYDVRFVSTNQALLKKRFKLKLKNEDLKNVMHALSTSGNGFEYQIKDKQVIIK